jgi:hypothetical protein
MLSEILGQDDSVIVISAPVVTLLVAVIIPIVNGIITKYTLPTWIKGFITLAMNTVVSMITTAASNTGAAVLSLQTLMTAAVGFITSVAMYSGIYRPANLTSSTVDGKLSPESGIGPASSG